MSFLVPLALSLFGLAAPLVLLYFIRLRRREQRVSSLLLWQALAQEPKAPALFQRFQRDPLLILQLLALLAASLALARPVVTLLGEGERKVVIVLDTSASMKARDVAPSRFEVARAEAAALVRGLREGTAVMVIEAGTQPKVAAALGADHGRALAAIHAAAARDLPNRLADAIRTARGLIGTDPGAEIHVFTDGAFAAAPEADDPRIRWVGAGRRSHNVGITKLAVRRTYRGVGNYEAFVSLANFSSQAQSFSFTLKVDDRAIVERAITLAPHVHRSLILPFRHFQAAHIIAELGIDDDLRADNVAHAVLPPPRNVAVTLVSHGNRFLENVLRTDPEVALQLVTPERYAGGMGDADVVVLDSVTPPKVGAGRYIFVNVVPPDVPIELLGKVERPTVVDWDRAHAVMRHVEFSKVAVAQAMRLRPLAPGRALVETLGGPLIYALEEPDRRALLLGFDLFEADLPLRVAFPLIMSNAIRWLHPSGHASLEFAAGQPLMVPVAHGVEAARFVTPSGRTADVRVVRGAASYSDADEVGLYTVVTARGSTRVAVNLMDADESNLAPQPLPATPAAAAAALVPVERELWPYFVALAACLFALEGLLYWRRESARRLRLPESAGGRWALALRGATLAALAAALLRPTVPQLADRMNVVFLLDASDSLSQTARARALQFVEQAVAARHADDRHGVVVFGADAAVAQPPAAHSGVELAGVKVDGRGTNIFQAIQLALALLPPDQANRIVLLSDGRQNAGDALAAARVAKGAGADLRYVLAPLGFEQEVVAQELVLPQEVKFGEPFYARVVAWSHKETDGRLSLFRNGEFVGSQRVHLTPGKNVLSYRQALELDGVHVYQAAIEVPGDTIEENNRAVGTVLVRGRPRVLIADRDRQHAQPLAAALRSQRIEVAVVDPAGIPKDVAALQRYDGVILSDISAVRLNRNQMAQIRNYVRDHGGGLIMVGGEESFGLGGYYKTPIEEALPVTMEVRQKVDIPNLSIVLSIDRSGSMSMATSGRVTPLDLAKEAAHLVIDLLDARTEVGVQSWDTEATWTVPLAPARNKAQIYNAIASLKAGGGTNGFPALNEAHRVLVPRPATLKHVIFLSDGQMFRQDFQDLVTRMARDQITVSTVALGTSSDQALMANIARWGRGRYYYTEDTQTITRIFALETQLASDATMVEQLFRPRVTDPGHEAMQDIDWKRAPTLGGYVATSTKSSAAELLTSHRDDPVLATWRYGLGRAAAFTSDANARWAGSWLQWPEFNKFWSQLVRWTLRSATTGDTAVSVVRRDGHGEVFVDAVDANGAFINFLETEIGVVAPDRSRTVIDLEQVGPGRYLGRFAAAQEGVYLVGMTQRKGDRVLGSQLTGLVVPYAEELRELGPDENLLKELAEATGGSELSDPRSVFLEARRPFRVALDIWPWLVALAAALVLPEIALRRADLGAWLRRRRKPDRA
ncbi:MAG TPA: VWA domain-containing protein [Burkholderiales bacterium]|nr:VWA domain-containing protein [Burkholderiales bacterium]